MESAFDGFFEKHRLKLHQYLQLLRYEQSFQEVKVQINSQTPVLMWVVMSPGATWLASVQGFVFFLFKCVSMMSVSCIDGAVSEASDGSGEGAVGVC